MTSSSLPLFDDPQMAARIRAGDVDAFREVFEAYHEPLVHFAYRHLRSSDAAREAVQDAFARVWEHRDTLSIHSTFRGYLYQVVRNVCVNEIRRRTRDVRREAWLSQDSVATPDSVLLMSTPGLSADEALEVQERREAIWRAIHRLPERRRLVMILRWQHHLSNPEIASTLRISVKGVEAHLARALASMAEDLEEYSA